MDAFSNYNQIQMDLEDEEFMTKKGLYYYKIMTFSLNNARITY